MIFNVGFAEFFFTASGATQVWTVPAGVYWVWVKAVAGGGGGGSSLQFFAQTGGAGGGGAGESCEGVMIGVTPGGTLNITIGGGGPYGIPTPPASYVNVHAGPEGNTAAGYDGAGGEDTYIGPIKLKGGYGGTAYSSGHGGCGGGSRAGPKSGTGGGGGTNCGNRIGGTADGAPGKNAVIKDCGRYWAGSGGAASCNIGTTLPYGVSQGGGQGPFDGGIEGPRSGVVTGGAGGGASIFGPGGNGGSAGADAPPAGSYGAGGGGAGGSISTGATGPKWKGATGGDGYVSLHYFVITP